MIETQFVGLIKQAPIWDSLYLNMYVLIGTDDMSRDLIPCDRDVHNKVGS